MEQDVKHVARVTVAWRTHLLKRDLLHGLADHTPSLIAEGVIPRGITTGGRYHHAVLPLQGAWCLLQLQYVELQGRAAP